MDNAEYERLMAKGDPDAGWVKWVGITIAVFGILVAVFTFIR